MQYFSWEIVLLLPCATLVPLEISVGSEVKILQMWEKTCLVLCKELMALDFSKYKPSFASHRNPVGSGKRNNCAFKVTSPKLNIPFTLFHHSWYFWVFLCCCCFNKWFLFGVFF